MKQFIGFITAGLLVLLVCGGFAPASAAYFIQCPCTDPNPPAAITNFTANNADGNIQCTVGGTRTVVCKALTAGDGFALMADRTPADLAGDRLSEIYTFGFHNVTGLPANQIGDAARLAAEFPGPPIVVQQGQEFYLTLSTTPFIIRPDLFDPHTVHFHGFPNASAVFDGEPMASLAPNPGASLTYYYNLVDAGTFIYHCHVEATEHMQMGMLAKLHVRPTQDSTATAPQLAACQVGGSALDCAGFAYNDNDGSTGYHISKSLLMLSFDPDFHRADQYVQPLNFAGMTDTYPMLNGKGYPDTINVDPLPQAPTVAELLLTPDPARLSQKDNALVDINKTGGVRRVLLRISSLATVDFFTLTSPSIPMKVVGMDSRIYRGGGVTGGNDLSYFTNSVNLGGGESWEVMLDVSTVPTGTYFLYSSNLNHLNNNAQPFGGMMTEIVVR